MWIPNIIARQTVSPRFAMFNGKTLSRNLIVVCEGGDDSFLLLPNSPPKDSCVTSSSSWLPVSGDYYIIIIRRVSNIGTSSNPKAPPGFSLWSLSPTVNLN